MQPGLFVPRRDASRGMLTCTHCHVLRRQVRIRFSRLIDKAPVNDNMSPTFLDVIIIHEPSRHGARGADPYRRADYRKVP